MHKFKAVLFDMDGVLVDSERMGIEVAVSIAKNNFDIELTQEEQSAFIGITDEKYYKELKETRKLDFDVDDILQKHFEVYEKALADSPAPVEGAAELIRYFHDNGYRLALVSGSTRGQVKLILRQLGVIDMFETIVSCTDIESSKPDPEGYLTAAKQLNCDPSECIVVEDALSGVTAAKTAGCYVIGFDNGSGQDITKADVIVSSLSEVMNLEL